MKSFYSSQSQLETVQQQSPSETFSSALSLPLMSARQSFSVPRQIFSFRFEPFVSSLPFASVAVILFTNTTTTLCVATTSPKKRDHLQHYAAINANQHPLLVCPALVSSKFSITLYVQSAAIAKHHNQSCPIQLRQHSSYPHYFHVIWALSAAFFVHTYIPESEYLVCADKFFENKPSSLLL